MGHMAALELTSSRKQGLKLRDTWQRRSSPKQGGEVWAVGHVVAPERTSAGRCGSKLQLSRCGSFIRGVLVS
jgi:hypothetical protein